MTRMRYYVTLREREVIIKEAEDIVHKARKALADARLNLETVRRETKCLKPRKAHFGHNIIVNMKDKSGLTFSEIGRMICLSASRARAMYHQAKSIEEWEG